MSPLVAPGRRQTQGAKPRGTRRSEAPGSEPRAAGRVGGRGTGSGASPGMGGAEGQGRGFAGHGGGDSWARAEMLPSQMGLDSPHLGRLFLQVGLQVTPAIVIQGPDHHLTATPGPGGHKEQPQAHVLPGKGAVSARAKAGPSPPPRPGRTFWKATPWGCSSRTPLSRESWGPRGTRRGSGSHSR